MSPKMRVWFASFALAGLFSLIGFSAHPAIWGMYIQLPGIVAGLFLGWAGGSRSETLTDTLVIGTTIVLNAVSYFGVYRALRWLARKGKPLQGSV